MIQPDITLVRILLAIANDGSISRAATMVGLGRHTLIRRIAELEADAGVPLVIRKSSGVELTAAGRSLVEAAEAIASATANFERVLVGLSTAKSPVSISAPEGIASYLIAPQAAGLRGAPSPLPLIPPGSLPPLDILAPNSRADIEITHVPIGGTVPRPAEYKARKLGIMRFRPVASRAFLEANGMPSSFEDLARFPLIQHASYTSLPTFQRWNELALGSARVFTASTSSALHRALITGSGVAMLPDFSELLDRNVVVLPLGEPPAVEIWETALPEALSLEPVRRTWDVIADAFARSPWFANA
ncbi:LysR family transcriptional regulator [Azospirillum sp.]|uniref:LysR family transcriptional regulator n=1 Tax=Azospirillum sp. TaxID=34012 RepID=UPI003D762358